MLTMEDAYLNLKWTNHSRTFMKVISNLHGEDPYTDASLACEGQLIPVHKFVLATCSDYFHEVFSNTPCKHPVIILKDITKKNLSQILNFMYNGEVTVLQEDLESLLNAGVHLGIKGLAVADDRTIAGSPFHHNMSEQHPKSSSKRTSRLDNSTRKKKKISHSTPIGPVNFGGIKHNTPEHVSINKKTTGTNSVESAGESMESYQGLQQEELSDHESQVDLEEECLDIKQEEGWSDVDDLDVETSIMLPKNEGFGIDKAKPFYCEICGHTFTRRDNLNNHIKTHTGEKPHQCQYCQKCFSRKDYLKQHERSHTGIKPYTCDQCDKSFTRKEGLTDHVRVHSDKKEFSCDVCDKSFRQKCGLRFHKRNCKHE